MKTEDAANRFLSNLPTLRRHRRVAARRSRLQSPARPTLNGRFFLGSVEKINYPGIGNSSQFSFDAFGGCVNIVERTAAITTTTKQFVRCKLSICEERNAASAIEQLFFRWGYTRNGSRYFYSKDHLESVRAVTDFSNIVQVQYLYDMWGVPKKSVGVADTDFQFAGYYKHARSGLNLTVYRAYSPTLGRWISREPRFKTRDANLYRYVNNNPVALVDLSGLSAQSAGNQIGPILQSLQRAVKGTIAVAGGAPPPSNDDEPPPPEPPRRPVVKTPLDTCIDDCIDWFCIDQDWIEKNIPEGNEKQKKLSEAEDERDECLEDCKNRFPTLWEIMFE